MNIILSLLHYKDSVYFLYATQLFTRFAFAILPLEMTSARIVLTTRCCVVLCCVAMLLCCVDH